MKHCALILSLIIGLADQAIAYPISPRPLRLLVQEAEFIIYAKVTDIRYEDGAQFGCDIATLSIQEQLQGSPLPEHVEVSFSPGMICPAPAHYEEGTMVLAFLRKRDSAYTTHALSHGSKTIHPYKYAIYKQRIQEMQQILALENDAEQLGQTLEWLVKCAEYSVTRWEGLYELSPQSDFMSYYDQNKRSEEYLYMLSQNQRDRLKEAFFSIDTLRYADIALFDIVYFEDRAQTLDFVEKKLRQEKDLTEIYEGWLYRYASEAKRSDLKIYLNQLDTLRYTLDYVEQRDSLIHCYQKEL